MPESICLGLMSGTSLDAIDAAACRFDSQGRWLGLLGTFSRPYPNALRHELLELQRHPDSPITLRDWARLDGAVGDCFADCANGLLESLSLDAPSVCVIGSHGQTVFHDPGHLRTSTQLGDPNRIAARTGIATAADLRRADMALGGQGAPLVPAFHHAVFGASRPRAVVNIGGIANITYLPAAPSAAVFGYDTGPGNALLDDWIQHVRGEPCDRDGAWAVSGQVQIPLLQACLADPYFSAPPPKSTGRDHFHLDWLRQHALAELAPADIQATLLELTAVSIANAVRQTPEPVADLLICGGGARNRQLMARIAAQLSPLPVRSTAEAGIDPAWVEAAAFAWLGWRRIHRQPGNLPAVTGARREVVLGGLYQP